MDTVVVGQVCVVVKGTVVENVDVELFVDTLVTKAVLVSVEATVEVDVLEVVTV